ncbi:MAG: hypothetical protein LBG76_04250 [Treponema sp.]|nr:hypothetical protein [Treponema sp.]
MKHARRGNSLLFACSAALLLGACAGLKQPPDPAPPSFAGADGDSETAGRLPEPDGFNRRNYAVPEGFRFIPAALPALEYPPGVGQPEASVPEAEKSPMTESFQNAYIEGLLQGIPLAGVLGGDLVHRWPPRDPVSWVQNWRHTGPETANSWGIPSLVLAICAGGNFADGSFAGGSFVDGEGETALVHGPILDFYGKSKGIGGANGAAGYGAPRGNVFFQDGGIAQAFDYGLILIAQEGASFIPWERLAAHPDGGDVNYVISPEIPAGIRGRGEGEEGAFRRAFRRAFRDAWRREAARRQGQSRIPPEADGPPEYIPWDGRLLSEEGEPASVEGVYLQYFDNAQTVFAALDAPALPFTVRVIRAPFLDALVAAGVLPGLEAPEPPNLPDTLPTLYRSGFTGALLEGFSRYGFPLTDALPRAGEDSWVEAQRFSRGWITGTLTQP